MKVQEFMKKNPIYCLQDTTLHDVANLMEKNEIGAIPVVDNHVSKKLIGIITDRDITCRAVARGSYPHQAEVSEFMTRTVATVNPDSTIDDVARVMKEKLVRRIPVVDARGTLVGMVSQPHITRHGTKKQVEEVAQAFSRSRKLRVAR